MPTSGSSCYSWCELNQLETCDAAALSLKGMARQVFLDGDQKQNRHMIDLAQDMECE